MSNWHCLDAIEVLHRLSTNAENGLSLSGATRRLRELGSNELIEKSVEGPWRLLWKQLTATMILILIVAALLSAALGDYRDAIAILAIVIFNALLGFRQEYQAERAIAALKKLAVPTVRVRRDGAVMEISARELVPGDIVLLEAGNLAPADCRLLETSNLRIQESSLTGESAPIDKTAQALASADLPLGDRLNMVYMGTIATYGRGLAVVTETGMATELGKIAAAIQTVGREPTRLQQRLDQLGRRLAIAIAVLIALIFAVGLLRGEELKLMFLTAVSLGVAAVPEGLPAVVTIALALGAKRMLKRQALIRKLPAVETLGSVTVICSDKTGTLTENCMTVTFLGVAGYRIDLTAHLRHARPVLSAGEKQSKLLQQQPALALLLTGAALCNDAFLESVQADSQHFHAIGDPTEGSLVVAAAQLGLWKVRLEQAFPRVAELPFDSERKRMTTIHQLPTDTTPLPEVLKASMNREIASGKSAYIAFTKGAPDGLLEVSSKIWIDGRTELLTDHWRTRISRANNQLAQAGMRILNVAFRPLPALPSNDQKNTWEQDLILVGGIGMIDPPRPEVKSAVQTCKTAGVRPVMITGDHPLTAEHIAHELGIDTQGRTLTGQDLDQLQVGELTEHVESVSVYARVSPQHKLDIVRALQNRGHIVAMTGDGVNDAPALKKADIGVAMGIAGTDVAKEAADMVLLDDNFATIVSATKEGRVIYDNIRKFIKYVLTGNCGELWAIVLALFWGMPLLLLPLQILWINLIADGLLALALSVEPAERNVMRRPPYKPNESIFSRGVGRDIFWIGLLLGLILLAVGHRYWATDQASWQTMVFSILAFSRMGLAQTMRSERDSLFRIGLLSNQPLLGVVALTFGLQLAIIYVPALQTLFNTTALSITELLISLMLSTIVFWAIELEKWLIRRKSQI
ncbi:MAG: cation-translocating P-type ATPase [Leptolyngbyaceae cyanobacterium MO_188.B28]|nr:cation-translocating P-type ATPase [Leptolyngbyaceae cyanobacterium MO_188.B28]